MKKQLFSFLIIFIILNAHDTFSQNFESGTIVKNGVSISGLIKYENWLNSPTEISFKRDIFSTEQLISAEEIESFSVNGEQYTAQDITIQMYSDGPNDSYQIAGKPYEAKQISGVFFLRNIFTSQSIKLFRMIDVQERTRFFLQKDTETNELYNYTKKIELNSYQFEKQMKGYIGQLQQSFSDCNIIVSNDLSYQEKPLIEICSAYATCRGETVILNKQRKSDKISITPVFNLGTLPYESNYLAWGAGINVSFPRNYGNKYARAEMSFWRFDNKNIPLFSLLAGSYFGSKNIRPFANLGITWNVSPLIGGGISYKKIIRAEVRSYIFDTALATNTLHGLISATIPINW